MKKGDIVKILHPNPQWYDKQGTVNDFKDGVATVEIKFELYSYILAFNEYDLKLVKPLEMAPRRVFEMPDFVTINEALRFDHEMKKPQYDLFQEIRVKQGLCPECGEKGRYHMSTPVCSKHGAY